MRTNFLNDGTALVKLPSGTTAVLTPGPELNTDQGIALLLAAMWRMGWFSHN